MLPREREREWESNVYVHKRHLPGSHWFGRTAHKHKLRCVNFIFPNGNDVRLGMKGWISTFFPLVCILDSVLYLSTALHILSLSLSGSISRSCWSVFILIFLFDECFHLRFLWIMIKAYFCGAHSNTNPSFLIATVAGCYRWWWCFSLNVYITNLTARISARAQFVRLLRFFFFFFFSSCSLTCDDGIYFHLFTLWINVNRVGSNDCEGAQHIFGVRVFVCVCEPFFPTQRRCRCCFAIILRHKIVPITHLPTLSLAPFCLFSLNAGQFGALQFYFT